MLQFSFLSFFPISHFFPFPLFDTPLVTLGTQNPQDMPLTLRVGPVSIFVLNATCIQLDLTLTLLIKEDIFVFILLMASVGPGVVPWGWGRERITPEDVRKGGNTNWGFFMH